MNTPGWFAEFFRSIFAALDSIGYLLLEGIYDVFFAVSSAEILSGNTISEVYGRLQLIFGVFMIFKLSLSILNIIIDPDVYKDKQKGSGTIVVRIAVMLVMLTLVIPINIPADGNKLNERINENGILFGFLYQFQESVISENVLGKLILGSNTESSNDSSNMSDMGGLMTLTVARAFMTPTLINDDASISDISSYTEENTACFNELQNDIHYFDNSVRAQYILNSINTTCDNDETGEVFAMQYTVLAGFVFSIVMSIIVLGFTVDVAVRAIKLAILRIISPIPIISYITPGAEKDGTFGNWVKTLTSTYLDLFIRLAIISFGAYVVVKLTDPDDGLQIITTSTNWFTSCLATIFVIIGILVFMKQAPKFFKDLFGIKGDGSLFGGIGAALGGAALLGGLSGSVISSARTGYDEGQEKGYGKIGSGWRGFRAGVGGLFGGAYAGGKAFMTNDKKVPGSVFSAMQKRNAIRGSGSTWMGRTRDYAQNMFLGSSPLAKDDAMIEGYNDFASLYKSVAAKADVDDMYEVDVGGTKHTVKDLKETYERLVNSNASASVLKHAQDAYKMAHEKVINAAMNGTYEDGLSEETKRKTDRRPFLSQMQIDIDNARKLNDRLGLDLNMSDAKNFKISSFDAGDRARNMKNTMSYRSRKGSQNKN